MVDDTEKMIIVYSFNISMDYTTFVYVFQPFRSFPYLRGRGINLRVEIIGLMPTDLSLECRSGYLEIYDNMFSGKRGETSPGDNPTL
jgi:hypothetical protein